MSNGAGCRGGSSILPGSKMGYNKFMRQKIPDFLIKKPGRLNPYCGWKTYKNKDVVFSLDKKIEHWDAHPDGIIVEIDKTLFLNGETKIFHERERERERFYVARPS